MLQLSLVLKGTDDDELKVLQFARAEGRDVGQEFASLQLRSALKRLRVVYCTEMFNANIRNAACEMSSVWTCARSIGKLKLLISAA